MTAMAAMTAARRLPVQFRPRLGLGGILFPNTHGTTSVLPQSDLVCRTGGGCGFSLLGPLTDFGSRGFAAKMKVFGYPPQRATWRYTGVHCHPGMPFGYKLPRKRQEKTKPKPNVKLRSSDYQLSGSPNDTYYLRPPYPPRINRTIDVWPHADGKKNMWPTKEHKTYPLKWKNVEYVFEPRLMRKPFGDGGERWSGPDPH